MLSHLPNRCLNIFKAQLTAQKHRLSVVLAIMFMTLTSGCTSLSEQEELTLLNKYPDIASRIQQVSALSHWSMAGKVAFINKIQKQSVSFNWLIDNNQNSQQLDLSTYLGINVLHLESQQNHHVIEVMNKIYEGDNLDEMLQQLAHINFPTKALHYWLRGIKYLPSDHITYNQQSHLPTTLTSHLNGQDWQVSYLKHHSININSTTPSSDNVALAKQVVIKQNDLTIKLNINQWNIL